MGCSAAGAAAGRAVRQQESKSAWALCEPQAVGRLRGMGCNVGGEAGEAGVDAAGAWSHAQP
eukprot:1503102-Prymnesium_polylepis.1